MNDGMDFASYSSDVRPVLAAGCDPSEDSTMKTLATLVITAAALVLASAPAEAQEYHFRDRMIPTGPNGYVYDAQSYYRRPPLYAPGGYYGGWSGSRYGRAMPPYGFGNPGYNGYNDPYYNSYGSGVRDFLRFGGADFYGW